MIFMNYSLEIRNIWEFGQRKDENGMPHQEDNIFPEYGTQKASDRIFILCDGMGGHAAGEVASKTVCNTMSRSLLKAVPFHESDINKAVDDAYDALDALDNSDTQGKTKMGTTMTVLVLHNNGATIAHMGDSRVYHIRPGKEREDTNILFQTRDHSLVNDLIAIKEITPEMAKTHPRRNVITRALQPHSSPRQHPDIKSTTNIKPGDYFFLCSDGMLEQMDDNIIRFIFSDSAGDIDKKTDMLTQATRENKDNHTAILVRVASVERSMQTSMPPLIGSVEDDTDSRKTTSDNPSRSEDNNNQKSRYVWFFSILTLLALTFIFTTLNRNTQPKPSSTTIKVDTNNSVLQNPIDVQRLSIEKRLQSIERKLDTLIQGHKKDTSAVERLKKERDSLTIILQNFSGTTQQQQKTFTTSTTQQTNND